MQYLKPIFKCNDNVDQKNFKKSKCLLTISVGQEVHEGDKFAATIDLVNEAFGSCILLIDDSLQRHSMALNQKENADFFYKASMLAGDLWLERNKKHYEKLQNLESIIRWDKWLQHPDYSQKQHQINRLILEDKNYQSALDSTVHQFLKRYVHRLQDPRFNILRAETLCADYLIEECSAFCLWPEMGCHYEVYPSKRNLAMMETHERFVLPHHANSLCAISIKFKQRKQFKPQFEGE